VAGAMALGFLALATAFVPLGAPPNVPKSPMLRHSAQSDMNGPSPFASTTAAIFASCCIAAVGVAALRRGSRSAPTTIRRARELALAYQDSGIDLSDNGKFAQGLVGGEGAWGPYNFDPCGFSRRYTEFLPYFREAELKHGRICMLAFTGLVVPAFVRIPAAQYSFENCPRVLDAHDTTTFSGIADGAGMQVLLFISIVEACCAKKVFEWNSLECAGDYGLRKLLPTDPEGEKMMRLKELKNARLAMIAFSGAVTQMALTGHDFPWLY